MNTCIAWLAKAEAETIEAKKEYDTILNEMRDPSLKAKYGGTQFVQVKELAKKEWNDCDRCVLRCMHLTYRQTLSCKYILILMFLHE